VPYLHGTDRSGNAGPSSVHGIVAPVADDDAVDAVDDVVDADADDVAAVVDDRADGDDDVV